MPMMVLVGQRGGRGGAGDGGEGELAEEVTGEDGSGGTEVEPSCKNHYLTNAKNKQLILYSTYYYYFLSYFLSFMIFYPTISFIFLYCFRPPRFHASQARNLTQRG
ncbi:hypothetical protein Droror1_Dr00004590 [Drosera rotundifolia]